MRYDESHESPDLIDRRGEEPVLGGGGASSVGLLYLVLWLLRRPWGWVVLLVLGAGYVALRVTAGSGSRPLHDERNGGRTAATDEDAPEVHFVSFVLDDAQASWEGVFARRGQTYRHAKLVLYTDVTRTACGTGSAATGPFYCPEDERVYLDLGFFRELSGKLGARGQFAQAYVVAHEIGHHVQKLLGTTGGGAGAVRGASGHSVRVELQADCYAGIWARSAEQRGRLEAGDIESALAAAAAVGDDRLQRMETGTVSPERWTHGSSEERTRWFMRGLEQGKLEACDTFGASSL